MAIIEVVPDEIRYWLASSIPVSVQEAASTVQGKVTVPGELRTLTNEEVSIQYIGSDACWRYIHSSSGPQIRLAQGTGAKTK